jgi:hypothetical protein
MARNFPEGYYKKFIPKGGIPERIYKYSAIDDNLKRSLKESYLWFSKPGDFNDPFDCYRGLVDFSGPEDYIRQLIMERFPGNRQERKLRAKEFAKRPKLVRQFYEEITEQTISRIGVCCFSLNHKNTLMWSHYAAKHKGVCLVFDPLVDPTYFLVAGIYYTDLFKPYNYFDPKEDALFWMVITKAEGWRYENEVRVISLEHNGKIAFPRAALKGLIFGCRTSAEEIHELKRLAVEAGHTSLSYQQAHAAKDSFNILLKDV